MKKSILLIAMLAITFSGISQVIGVNFAEAIVAHNASDIVYEKLIMMKDGYAIPFEQTPVGLKHCIERLDNIMVDNDLYMENAISKDIFLASYIEGLNDYSNLCTSAKAGSSEVHITWVTGGYLMVFMITKTTFVILFTKAQP